MQPTGAQFVVDYQGGQTPIIVFADGKETLYQVHFPADKPFFIIKAFRNSANPFWTSIPEGKQELAEAFGALIDAHNEQAKGERFRQQGKQGQGPLQPTLF